MANENTNYLEIRELTKQYPLQRVLFDFKNKDKKPLYKLALDEVSFCLTPGLYGLLGPNGAGKSTLMNIITGSLNQTSGKVIYNGTVTRKLDKKFRKILGYMPQQQTLYENFTGRQFLQYMCALKEIKSNVGNEIERVTAAVNLTSELDKLLGAYSGGMKQRLLCANALLGTPKVLVLDEPTAGLDPKERVRLRELMKKTSENAIVLIATHVVQDIESVADEILLLKAGELVDMASPKDLINEYASGGSLEDVYLNIFGQGEV